MKQEQDHFSFRKLHEIVCPIHVNGEMEFVFAEECAVQIVYENRGFTLQSGEMAVIPPYHTHGFRTEGKALVWILMFSYEIAEEYLKGYGERASSGIIFRPTAALLAYLRSFYDRLENEEPDLFAKRGFFNCLASEYISVSSFSQRNEGDGTLIRDIMKYLLETVLTEEITMETLARAIGASPYEVQRQFRSYLGISLHEFINNMRVQHAVRLIRATSLSMTEIAYRCGFGSVRTFNRAFKTIHHVTPSEYRYKNRTKIL